MSENILNEDNIKDITSILEGLADGEDALENFEAILALPDDSFEIIASVVLDNFAKSINSPNDKLILLQSLNSAGIKKEELMESFNEGYEAIKEMEELSEPKKDFFIQILGILSNAVAETEGISKRIIQIPIELCHENAKIPQYAHLSDSGMDVFAIDDYTIAPGETKLIPTGLKVAIPPGYELQVRPKSGRALKTKLRIANTPGTIDAGYRDEIGIIVENVDPPIRAIHFGKTILEGASAVGYDSNGFGPESIEYGSSYTIGKGEKFCQLVLSEVPKVSFFEVNKVSEIGEDRGGGFGSTGVQ